jgi:hypothetical protein
MIVEEIQNSLDSTYIVSQIQLMRAEDLPRLMTSALMLNRRSFTGALSRPPKAYQPIP